MTFVNDRNFSALEYFTADNIHLPDVAAIFTTRNGGVSGNTPETEHLRSLDLALSSEGENYENTVENYRIIASSHGFQVEDVVGLQQVHGDIIINVGSGAISDDSILGRNCKEADALVTNEKGILLSVRVADCVPILLYDSKNEAVGAVHAGWQGTFLQIGTKVIRRMNEQYGSEPTDIQVAIGPAIGMCCYEVDFYFYEQFLGGYGEKINEFFSFESGAKPHCDLKAMNKAFFIEAGIPEANIDMSKSCTMCDPGLFYSHRRSGTKRGSMAAFIGMK